MAIVGSGLVQQEEVRERVKQLQELVANDPDVARIDHRIAEDGAAITRFSSTWFSTKKHLLPQQYCAFPNRSPPHYSVLFAARNSDCIPTSIL
jgi:hypothetical protein